MKTVFYLSTCDTCRKVIGDFKVKTTDFTLRDIKKQAITEEELDQLKVLAGSYESLFNRRAKKYRANGLKEKEDTFTEKDYKDLILSEYTYLRRPIFVDNDKISIGTSSKAMHQVATMMAK